MLRIPNRHPICSTPPSPSPHRPNTHPPQVLSPQFPRGHPLDLHLFISEQPDWQRAAADEAPAWTARDLALGMPGVVKQGAVAYRPSPAVQNNGSVFVHAVFTPTGASPNPTSACCRCWLCWGAAPAAVWMAAEGTSPACLLTPFPAPASSPSSSRRVLGGGRHVWPHQAAQRVPAQEGRQGGRQPAERQELDGCVDDPAAAAEAARWPASGERGWRSLRRGLTPPLPPLPPLPLLPCRRRAAGARRGAGQRDDHRILPPAQRDALHGGRVQVRGGGREGARDWRRGGWLTLAIACRRARLPRMSPPALPSRRPPPPPPPRTTCAAACPRCRCRPSTRT